MLIDEFLPEYDVRERHQIEIRAPLEQVYAAVRELDMTGARMSRMLMRIRGMRVGSCFTLDDFLRMRFAILGERPNHELLLGLAGRFWSMTGGLRPIDALTFRTFDDPASARAVWNFSLAATPVETTILTTETRVHCTDAAARRRFRLYWTFVAPFSALIRREVLRELKRQAERLPAPR